MRVNFAGLFAVNFLLYLRDDFRHEETNKLVTRLDELVLLNLENLEKAH